MMRSESKLISAMFRFYMILGVVILAGMFIAMLLSVVAQVIMVWFILTL